MQSLTAMTESLVAARHASHDSIEQRSQQISMMWADVKEMTEARLEVRMRDDRGPARGEDERGQRLG